MSKTIFEGNKPTKEIINSGLEISDFGDELEVFNFLKVYVIFAKLETGLRDSNIFAYKQQMTEGQRSAVATSLRDVRDKLIVFVETEIISLESLINLIDENLVDFGLYEFVENEYDAALVGETIDPMDEEEIDQNHWIRSEYEQLLVRYVVSIFVEDTTFVKALMRYYSVKI